MSGSIPQINSNQPAQPTKTLWEQKAPGGQRDLILKKMTVALIAIINLAGIAALFTYVCMKYPIATKPLFVSPFAIGVLGSLTYLKIPTLGINSDNYTSYSNPAVVAARAVTLAIFGPVILYARWIDKTNYRDPYVANQIKEDFEKKGLEEIFQTYGPRIANLRRYGYLEKGIAQEFQSLYKRAKPLLASKRFVKQEKAENTFKEDSLTDIKTDWGNLKARMTPENSCFTAKLPSAPDFSKTTTKIKIFARNRLGLYFA